MLTNVSKGLCKWDSIKNTDMERHSDYTGESILHNDPPERNQQKS